MELVIAEKPSVARDLARVMGARPAGKGAYEGNGRVITWCVGHLVELDEPASYDGRWKAWRLETLPMLPAEFKLRPAKHARDQLKCVVGLLRERRFTSVVNACDAGREGELIFRYVLQYAGRAPPVKRLWISSLTDDAIRRGFAALRPGAQLDALGDAARARSEADWLVGMNATRAITVRLRDGGGDLLFSIGRVQTPTLAMLVAREHAIRNFVPRDYWEVRGTFTTAKQQRFVARWSQGGLGRLGTAALADALVARTAEHGGAADCDGPRVARVRSQTVREPPPMLFDLTSLQRTANRRFGFSAQRTLDLAQALYERHKLLTYPRTDSRHLTTDVAQELPAHLAGLDAVAEYAPFVARLQAQPPRPNRRIVDDSKVQDHHAIIPTGKAPVLDRLDRDERRLFDLVVRRFLGAFFPDAEFAVTDVLVRVGAGAGQPPAAAAAATPATPAIPAMKTRDGSPNADDDDKAPLTALPPPPDWFTTRGRVRLVAGWQEVAGLDDEPRGRNPAAGDDDATGLLPPLVEGQPLDGAFAAQAKQTQPPRRHTEATLLSAMESAGKTLTDDELRAAMRDTGLGTPATRAAVIETLLQRDYVRREQKLIVPTATGLALIDGLPVPSLASPELTGAWEARLARIARGQESRAAFMADIAGYVRDTVDAIRQSEPKGLAPGMAETKQLGAGAGESPTIGRCVKCGAGVRESSRGFACVAACGFLMRKNVAGRAIGAKLAAVLLARRRSEPLRGFRSKAGKRFAAALRLEDDGSLTLDFAGGPARKSGGAPSASSRRSGKPSRAAKPPRATSAAGASKTTRAKSKPPRATPAASAAVVPRKAGPSVRHEDGGQQSRVDAAARAMRASASSVEHFAAPAPAAQPAAPRKTTTTPIAELPCPRCRQGTLLAGKRGWGCSRWRLGCGFVVWFETAGRTLSDSQLRDLVVRGQTRRARFSPAGAPAEGRLVLDVDGAGGARFTAEDSAAPRSKRTS